MRKASGALNEGAPALFLFCDRCARRSTTLISDDLTLQELCQDCFEQLERRRSLVLYPKKPRI